MTLVDTIAHRRIPFPAEHYRSDNDKSILKVLFEEVKTGHNLRLSRSRPYQKNDNAHGGRREVIR